MRDLRAFALLALAVLPGCNRGANATRGPKPVKARVLTVEQKEVRRDVLSVGSLFPYEEVAVSSEVEGKVERVLVDVGDRVGKGQGLVKVLPVELELGADQQRAAYEQTRARLGLPEGGEDLRDPSDAAEVKRAQAALGDAQQKYERSKSLYDEGLISKWTYDEAEANYKSAKAAYDMARQSVENLRAELQQKRAGLRLAEKKLSDSLIRAPFAGQVKARMVTQGQYLRVQTPVMVIVNIDPLRVRLKVPEKVAGWIEVDQPVAVTVEAYPGRTFTGTVSRMSPSVDTETRTLELEALLKNDEGLLKPGFFARATIASDQVESVLTVPHEAVRYVFGVYKVFTVDGRTLKEQEVKLGERSGDKVEVVEGLKDRQKIAVPLEGQEPVDGAPVEAAQ
ncbi:MAG TPA: efflux RND transporter periplasmic adaptor subunit [Vicinamibacteria bacterium]